jgi:glucokinase
MGLSDYYVGCDLGGTKILSVIYDADFKPIGRARKKTKGHEGQEFGLKRIGDTIEEAMEDAGIATSKPGSIGIGCPGPLDLNRGIIREAPNLGWVDAPVKSSLEARFSCPVTVANDVDLGVYGEYRFGAGQGYRCVVGLFPGTGIGGGCVYQGEIFRGNVTSCMEVGHIQIMADGPHDGAGNAGTLEALASRLRVAAEAAQAVYRGQAPALRKKAGMDISEIRSGALAHAVENGDEAVIRIIENAAEYLGVGIVTLVHLLAPDVVIMGGGMVEALPDLIVKTARKSAKKRVLPSYRDQFEVVAAKLGDDAAVMGAAAWGRHSLEVAASDDGS